MWRKKISDKAYHQLAYQRRHRNGIRQWRSRRNNNGERKSRSINGVGEMAKSVTACHGGNDVMAGRSSYQRKAKRNE